MTISRRGLIVGAAGGLGAARPDQHYEPPAGGQAITGARGVVRARQVIIVGGNPPGSGLYVYSPAIASGDLVDSIAANGGLDSVNNRVIQGIANYANGGAIFQAIALQNGQLTLYTAATEHGPWTLQGIINCGGLGQPFNLQAAGPSGQSMSLAAQIGGQIVFQSPFFGNAPGNEISAAGIGTAPLLLLDNTASNLGSSEALAFIAANVGDRVEGIQVSGDTFDRHSIAADGSMTWGPGNATPLTSLTPAAGAGLLLLINRNNTNAITIQNLGTNGGQSLIQLVTSTSTDRAVGIQAAGDTSERIRIDSVPQLLMGSGAAAGDCLLGRAGPQEFYSDGIAAKVAGGPEVWNAPTFANGWANAAIGVNLQYRLVAAPYNEMQWIGRIIAPAGLAAGQAINVALPSAYRPAHIQSVLGIDITSGGIVRFQMQAAGTLLYEAGAAAGDSIEIPSGLGLVSLDA